MKTKIIYTIIIASFFLLSTISYAQTKEESLEWLYNNMELLVPTAYCSGINNETAIGNFKIENDSLISTWEWQGFSKKSLAIKDLLYQETNLNDLSDKSVHEKCPELGFFIFQSKKDKIVYESTYSNGKKSTTLASTIVLNYKKEDKNNALRVIKAIMHLAKLSGATENKQIF